jgi:hypothetical protein
MDQRDYYGTTRTRSLFWPAAMLLSAFLLGIVATALAIRHWNGVATLIRPVPAVQPVPAVPQAQTHPIIVQPAPPDDPALDERVAAIESRIDAIDQRAAEASGDADRAEALLVAFAARRALDRGQPLGYIEGLLRERFGGTDAASVAQIIAAAQRPVTLAQLQDGLAALRPTLESRAPDQSVWQSFRQELGSLFVLRHGDEPSNIPADRMSRADHALEQGQVDTAATEIARMPGAARANDWLAQARRYVLARNALDRIETAALLSPAPKPAPTLSSSPKS